MTEADFCGTHLRWPFSRTKRPFVVRVVEPTSYKPASHAEIFNAALTAMLEPTRRPLDTYESETQMSRPRQFDLITFPEAFIDAEALYAALGTFRNFGASGCVHTGLRASLDDQGPHLFTPLQIRALTTKLESLLPAAEEDLAPFSQWLASQDPDDNFNLGCLFVNDADGRTRVCLHPKLVRSNVEISHLRAHTMSEANFLTLITLVPKRKEFGTITLQPLICSDALTLATDSGRDPPMKAVNRFAGCLGDAPPDHVDIVSVVTCTPQTVVELNGGAKTRIWHEQFRTSFLAAARDQEFARHHFAAIVLANFREIKKGKAGGLSGIFLPVAPVPLAFGPGTIVSPWGRPSDKDPGNRWSRADETAFEDWSVRGFIAALDPTYEGVGRIFGFTIHRLQRELSLWEPPTRLTETAIWDGVRDQAGKLTFALRGSNYE